MQRFKENKAEAQPTTYELFNGDVRIQDILTPNNAPTILMHSVNFTDGARTQRHTHGSEQVLVVTSGTGVVATRDQEWTIEPGDIVLVDAGEAHWHGASEGESMTHLVFMTSREVEILDE